MKTDIYKDYTSTSVLHGNVNEKEVTNWSIKYFKKFLLPHFSGKKDIKILEIGCGYGRYTKAVIESGYHNIVGIDISQEQIAYARNNMGLTNVEVADALEFLEQDVTYDLILLMDVLEHLDLDYSIKLLKKIFASLSTEGKFIVHVPNGLAPLSPPFYGDVTHVRAYSVDSMSQIMRMAGFKVINHYALPPLITGFTSFVRRLLWSYLLSPMIKVFLLIANGGSSGGIYTSNLLTVAVK